MYNLLTCLHNFNLSEILSNFDFLLNTNIKNVYNFEAEHQR